MLHAAARRIPTDCIPDVIYYNERNNKNKFIAAAGKMGLSFTYLSLSQAKGLSMERKPL